VIEQITYLLFITWLNDLHTAAERKTIRLKRAVERPAFNERPSTDFGAGAGTASSSSRRRAGSFQFLSRCGRMRRRSGPEAVKAQGTRSPEDQTERNPGDEL
jgi:hypothetical protein